MQAIHQKVSAATILVTLLVFPGALLANCSAALDFHVRPLAGNETVHLCETLRDRVVLIVNTASKCAYTPQYDGLENLYAQYKKAGLVVVGFPSNDFAGQEPGTEKEIQNFCRNTYAVKFPMFEKVSVKGDKASPLYHHLTKVSGKKPAWNFHKYLLNRRGDVVASFPSQVTPDDKRLISMIESLL